jgi:hypothetical protein
MTNRERILNWKLFSNSYISKPEVKKKFQRFFCNSQSEEKAKEYNDIYIYKTLRYPPNSVPPTAN